MRFLTLPPAEAAGAILVHGLRAGGHLFKKGRVLTAADAAMLVEAGIAAVTVVRLEPQDVPEDEAATRVAEALGGEGLRMSGAFTGRTNLYAEDFGLVILDAARIDSINLIDEAVTVATLLPFAIARPGDMIATIKIIPFAAPDRAVAAAVASARQSPIRLAPFRPFRAALISTQLSGQKPSLLDKNRAALEARITDLTGTLMFEKRCPHDAAAIAEALREADASGAEILFVFGASAITDRRDSIPAGIVTAGGTILHFGMPVDPGNLLLLGRLKEKTVIGLPSCARSPKVNGFDFVLQRLFAGIEVTPADIMRMGVGGLLQEIATRPQPRAGVPLQPRAPKIAALVLAAGRSTRMGSNKLMAEWRGRPLIRSTVEVALKSGARPVIVVTGHESARIETALAGLDVRFVYNPHYAEGLSTSLKAGLHAVPGESDGALVMLGDMPEIASGLIDRMIAAFSPADGRTICVATHEHRRGNPVLWCKAYFKEIELLTGDAGAKAVFANHEDCVCELEAGEAALRDVDTPEALAALRAGVAEPAK